MREFLWVLPDLSAVLKFEFWDGVERYLLRRDGDDRLVILFILSS